MLESRPSTPCELPGSANQSPRSEEGAPAREARGLPCLERGGDLEVADHVANSGSACKIVEDADARVSASVEI
jgi:hypothetical protein